MFAMRELSGPLALLMKMVTYSSFCNEPFSLGVLQLLKVRAARRRPRGAAEMKPVLNPLTDPAGDGAAS